MLQRNSLLIISLVMGLSLPVFAESPTSSLPVWQSTPLSLAKAMDVALQQNGNIQRAKNDLEAQYGVVVQTRAVAIPKLQANGNYQYTEQTEKTSFPNFPILRQTWSGSITLSQNIYQGGNIQASLKTAKLTREQAVLNYQTTIADSLLQVRTAYYDVQLADEQVVVEEASVKLLTQQLEDQQRRFNAGTVPRFNVLQAEVALSNEKPKLIKARNTLRVSKNNLVNLLGYHLSIDVLENVPMELTDKLDDIYYQVELPVALSRAFENRSELASLRKSIDLGQQSVVSARSGYKPTISIFGEYGDRNSQFVDDPAYDIHGVTTGVQATWSIFDGFLTKGKVQTAKARLAGSRVDVDNEMRSIELEVRTDYSNLIEAWETLQSQKKVQEEAEEALRLARVRNDAGTGTQLDVLSAETSLTQARSTQVQALHDYDVARARMDRAMGLNLMHSNPAPSN